MPAPARPNTSISLFYSYSHRDEALREKLETHLSLLKDQRIILDWHDRRIQPGMEWDGIISENLNQAGIILLLISADFMDSRYCHDIEVARAMERHEAGTARVIPVILRPVDWHHAPFGKLQPLPKDGKPITEYRNRDRGFLDVARGIRTVAENLPSTVLGSSPSARPSAAPLLTPHELTTIMDETRPLLVVEPPDKIVVEVLEALPGRPISGERLVRPDGTISLRFYGDVHVAGLTLPEIKGKIVVHLLEFLSDEILGLATLDETGDLVLDPETGEPKLKDPKDSDRFLSISQLTTAIIIILLDMLIFQVGYHTRAVKQSWTPSNMPAACCLRPTTGISG